MKFSAAILGLSLLLASLAASQETKQSASNWMATLDDQRLISSITLPGTHNAGALHEPLPNTARCQSKPIAQQLAFGVRLLDIRCCHQNDAFHIRHGIADQNLTFDAVVNTLDAFLTTNASECIVMSVAETHRPKDNTRSFAATLADVIKKNPERWHTAAAVPRLGQVRGKIVLLRRFGVDRAARPLGLDASQWPGNQAFRKNGLRVQDRFRAKDTAEKWRMIAEGFKAANAEKDPRVIHLNFTSGYEPAAFGLPNITAVSKVINPKLEAHLKKSPRSFHGWLMMDFANPKLAELIFLMNDPK